MVASMQTLIPRVILGLGVACVTALVFGLVFAAGLGTALAIAAGALVGGATAAVAAVPSSGRHADETHAGSARETVTTSLESADVLSRLRHDLRGVLSPALLTADRLLASSDDPTVRRAAETMIETVERATALLAAPQPHGADLSGDTVLRP